MTEQKKHFFISYNGKDQDWAKWIAWQLEKDGYSVIIQARDFPPGGNFVLEMQKATTQTDRTLVVLSPNYLSAEYTQPEWAAAFVQDPKGEKRTLLPVRVAECEPDGLLKPIIYIDLVSLDEAAAKEELLARIKQSVGPSVSPSFPGGQGQAECQPPRFPKLPSSVGYQAKLPEGFPDRNRLFTGREQKLLEIKETLTNKGRVALKGLGGVGKTQTAIEYAYRHLNDYDYIFWATADFRERLVSSYMTIASQLKILKCNVQDQSDTIKDVKDWLTTHDRWLLVIDNTNEIEIIPDFIPSEQHGHVLLTTQARALGTLMDQIEILEMGNEEGELFLLRRAKCIAENELLDAASESDQAIAKKVVEQLGGLPLALDQAGAYIEQRECGLLTYLEFYSNSKYTLELLQHRGTPHRGTAFNHPDPVTITWALSFEKIESANRAAAELLRLCAFLYPDGIPGEIFNKAASEPKSKLRIAGLDAKAILDARSEILKYSLLRVIRGTNSVKIHRLVQTVLKQDMDENTQKFWAERAVRAVNLCFPEVEFDKWADCQRLLSNAEICIKLIREWKFEFNEAAKLLNKTATYFMERGRFSEAEPLFRHAEKILGGDNPEVITILNGLAGLMYVQGRYKDAKSHYEIALRTARKVPKLSFKNIAPDVATSLNGLAVLNEIEYRYDEAEKLYKRSLRIREEYIGSNHYIIAHSLNNLAALYYEKSCFEKARLLYQKSLEKMKKSLNKNHPYISASLEGLASIYISQGDFDSAEECLQESLKILETTFGSDHPDLADSYSNLAALYYTKDQYMNKLNNLKNYTGLKYENGVEKPQKISPTRIYPVPSDVAAHAWINNDQYLAMYQRSVDDPEGFWAEQANQFVTWFKPWNKVLDWDFTKGHIRWFEGAKLNVSYNCLDRHLATRGDQIAIIWEGDNPAEDKKITYRELHEQVCRFANALKDLGVKKGDRVCIYLPMIPEVAITMLACARIGAVHSVVFGGFSPESLKDRINDSTCSLVITADEGLRGGRKVPFKENADKACAECPSIKNVVVVRHTSGKIHWAEDRDLWYHDLVAAASPDCPPEHMDAEDPLFILYISGFTSKPKGVLHTTGGYLLHVACSHKYIFDYHDGDIFWCTADVGWVAGHSYIVYGPLANGATTIMFEGIPTYPDFSRFWQVVDKHQVNIFYTAPTAIRALMREGEEPVKKTSRKSLRLLGTVGEPINPETWEWYYHVVGEDRCPILDTWWQTETGGILITPLPGATVLKPGSATRPFFGVCPALVDFKDNFLEGATDGHLVITRPWPGMMRTVYGDHQWFIDTYFYKGLYFTGADARRDEDGYYWISGRVVNDVINVSGHRMGTAEVASALVLHPAVADAAVVGFPHDLKGHGIYAYVTLKAGIEPTGELRKELIEDVRKEIGAIATPDVIQWAPDLIKTRGGKIMRRILRKIAANELDQLGDTFTLVDPTVVTDIIDNRNTTLIENYYDRALKIKQKSLGDEHPDVAVILNNIAELYRSRGHYSEAEQKYKRVLEILEKTYGPQHLRLVTVLENYADMLKKIKNRTDEAEQKYKRVLEILEKAYGPQHLRLVTVLENYADMLKQIENRTDDVALIEKRVNLIVLENYADMLKQIENRTDDVALIEKRVNLIRSKKLLDL